MKKIALYLFIISVASAISFLSCKKETSCEGCINGVSTVVTTNHPPIANAGADQTITLPTNSVIIDGNGSTDPDNNITSFSWTKISGPSSFNFGNANIAQTQVANLIEGIYQFELIVTDAGGLNDKDTVHITVNTSPNSPLVNIYVAGGGVGGPKYWKNGQAVSLAGSGNIGASSIAVNGNDVHVTGGEYGLFWYEESGAYWKNGQSVFTVGPGNLSSVTVSGNDVYVAGYEYTSNASGVVAKYWKNGQAVPLTNGSSFAYVYDIAVAGSDVYVAGEEAGVAKYWKNGQAVLLSNGSYARSIVVVGSDVYVAGNNGTVAKYWKNGQEISLTNGATTAYANSIAVVGSDVYVAGWEGDYYNPVAKYWKNGQAVSLATSPSFAWSIAIFGTDVYVAGGIGGWGNSAAVYWKNGQAVSLPNGSSAGGIVVVN